MEYKIIIIELRSRPHWSLQLLRSKFKVINIEVFRDKHLALESLIGSLESLEFTVNKIELIEECIRYRLASALF